MSITEREVNRIIEENRLIKIKVPKYLLGETVYHTNTSEPGVVYNRSYDFDLKEYYYSISMGMQTAALRIPELLLTRDEPKFDYDDPTSFKW
tara:strand:- start:329 stop:604 length:276 start_codon:yes stop_codon:yes gene_type:complete